MNDQQLKIRIKLNQVPQFSEASNSEETVNQTKPPFDRIKISTAVLLFVIMLSGALLWLFAEESEQPVKETLSAENTQSKNSDSLAHDKDIEPNDLSINNSNTSSEIPAPTMKPIPVDTRAPESIKATTNLGHTIIPLRKPEIAKNKINNQSTKTKATTTD